jgi:hypothetical protein
MDQIKTEHLLTGRVRGRYQRITGKIVMQVEVAVHRAVVPLGSPCPPPPWCGDRVRWEKEEQERLDALKQVTAIYWRDARPDDVADVKVYRAFDPT